MGLAPIVVAFMAQSLLDMHEIRDAPRDGCTTCTPLFLRAVDGDVMRQAANTFSCDGVLACQTMLLAMVAQKTQCLAGLAWVAAKVSRQVWGNLAS